MPRAVEVCDADRAVLEARVAASTTPRRDWQRAKVVLMAAEGLSSPVIGEAVGLNRNQVDTWRRRWREEGLDGLSDRPRSGRPRVYGPKERLALVKTITTRPPEAGQLGRRRLKARMSMPEVGRILREDCGIAISDSQVWRICTSMGLKPWQVRSWMTSHDSDFDDKAADVCALYLSPEDNWAVFSVDEKTGIQAKSRTNPTRPAQPRSASDPQGRPARQEFEYRRHGTAALFAAFECATGEVVATPVDSIRSDNFVAFLAQLDSLVPAHLELHCIVDNLATHSTAAVEEFLDDHHRVFLHRTPTHASWLNQIEMWFSILTRQLLHTAEFAHTSDLAAAILDYIDDYNNRAKPFKWTYHPQPNSHKTYARDH
jgi:transposase